MAVDAATDGLQVEGLRIAAGERVLVHDVSLRIGAGELVALVGSSGSGKTVTARALLGMLPFQPGRVGGTITVRSGGRVLQPSTEADFRSLRGGTIGMLWQDARAALDPLWTIAAQVREAIALSGASEPPEA